MQISEAAQRIALSSDQIEQIENGGADAFHSAGHKWLATRRYARILGIELADNSARAAEDESDARADDVLTKFGSTDRPMHRRSRAGMVVPAVALLIAAVVLAVSYSMLKQLESVLPMPASVQVPVPPAAIDPAPASAPRAAPGEPDATTPPPGK